MATEATTCAGCGVPVASGTRLCSECERDLTGAVYAGFWTRFLALIIDALILLIPNIIIGAIADFPLNLLSLAIGLAYTVGFWVGNGATPGKMAVGVVITTVDGEPIGLGTAVLRYVGYIVSWITIGIGYLMIAFRGDKRGLHDLMADTVVIKRDRLERYRRSRGSTSL